MPDVCPVRLPQQGSAEFSLTTGFVVNDADQGQELSDIEVILQRHLTRGQSIFMPDGDGEGPFVFSRDLLDWCAASADHAINAAERTDRETS